MKVISALCSHFSPTNPTASTPYSTAPQPPKSTGSTSTPSTHAPKYGNP